jgi:outer membrane lipoprotein-sorting protein
MKRALVLVLLWFGAAAVPAGWAATVQSQSTKPESAPAKPASSTTLEQVLNQMDAAAANFRTAQANFVWDQYQKVVNDTDTQKGMIYFRRSNKDVQMAADIQQPATKYVLYTNGTVQVYEPRMDQVTKYSAGKNRADFESFLVLGFGGHGHDLPHSFEVALGGAEQVDGIETARLDLVPKSQRAKGMFNKIVLWIDLARGISVKQQFFEPSGDYRLARYSNIKLNQKLPDDAFKLKTTGKTRFISPQSSD